MTLSQPSPANTVCLLDDDLTVLKALKRLLTSEGIAAQSFNQPGGFLEFAARHSVSVAILDIWMEGMTGLEVQEKLAKLSPHTRVIIMSGRQDSAVERTALEAGATAYFRKPFDDEEFLAAVRAAVAQTKAQE